MAWIGRSVGADGPGFSSRFSDPRRVKSRKTGGFSLTEVIVVFAIIGLMIGVGAVTYKGLLDTNRIASGGNMIAGTLTQARQFAVALREARRVAVGIERLDAATADTEPLIDRENPPVKIWVEGKRVESRDFSDTVSVGGNTVSNTLQVGDSQSLPAGVTVASVYLPGYNEPLIDPGTKMIGSGTQGILYVEFDGRGQLAGVYFGGGNTPNESNRSATVVGGQVYLHVLQWAEQVDPGSGPIFYNKALNVGGPLSNIGFEHEREEERFKCSTVEILRLTGRVRNYDYGIGQPWSAETLTDREA